MTGKMNWGRSRSRQIQARAEQGFGPNPKDADAQRRANAAEAFYYAKRRLRDPTIGIREAAEQSTRQRKVTVTLPKLKFLEQD